MDQIMIGKFLKELRKEKNITQEQLADKLNVSGRTVSRWETGNNMPDISILVEMAELFDVSIPEIINGERKSEKMDDEQMALADAGIRLYGGVQGSADEAAKALAEGRLDYDPNARCDHHDHEHHGGECSHGSCADHHCHGN